MRRKQSAKGTKKKREGGGGTTKLSPVSKDLNLGYPTWYSLSGWVVKTVMPFI